MSQAGGWITAAEAAEVLGRKPWDVVRLADAGAIESVLLIRADSLTAYQEAQK